METSGNRTALGVSADIAQLVGNRLRRARESIGRSTSALSAKIKVREHYLVAIEDGQWNELPPGLNGRGLVRIYARELSVSVPELDQAANASVMPAEQDAQAPYQVSQKREAFHEREAAQIRTVTNVTPAQTRMPEATTRTNTLNPSQRPSRINDLPPVLETRPTGNAHAGFRTIESTPEEEPLDVITPDVASILGITLETFEEAPKSIRSVQPVQMVEPVAATAVKVADAIPVTADSSSPVQVKEQVHFEETSHKKQNKKNAKNKHEHKSNTRTTASNSAHEEIPLVLPEVFIEKTTSVANEPPVIQTAAAAAAAAAAAPAANPVVEQDLIAVAAPVDASTHVAPVEQATAFAEMNLEAKVNPAVVSASFDGSAQTLEPEAPAVSMTNDQNEPATLSVQSAESSLDIPVSTSPGVSAAEGYLRSHALEEHSQQPSEISSNKAQGQPMRWAIGLVAASVVALVLGQVFLRPDSTSTETNNAETPIAENGTTASSEKIEVAAEQPPVAAEVAVSETSTASAGAASGEQTLEQTTASVSDTQTQPPATVADANKSAETATSEESPSQSEAATAAAAQSPQVEASSAENSSSMVATSGASAAVLTLSEPLEIQITADGKKIFSGKHNSGKVEIKFNKRAEIFVQDGSKAQLKYAGWDHGTLGLSGRKRRIVLNAEKFNATGN